MKWSDWISDKKYAGEYTCGNASDLISGEGALIVGEPALKIIIR
jgi:hypothetical protein